MTPAERQQLKRDRRKAGLVRVEAWVPADKAQDVRDAIGWLIAAPKRGQSEKKITPSGHMTSVRKGF